MGNLYEEHGREALNLGPEFHLARWGCLDAEKMLAGDPKERIRLVFRKAPLPRTVRSRGSMFPRNPSGSRSPSWTTTSGSGPGRSALGSARGAPMVGLGSPGPGGVQTRGTGS